MDRICKEILLITRFNKEYDKKVQDIAKKVTNYIKLKESGHFKYGIGYLSCQVRNHEF